MVVRGVIPPLVRNDDAMPAFLVAAVPAALAGLIFAGAASAIMSTVNAFLSVGAAAIMHDLPMAFGRKPSNELARGRAATVALAVVAVLVAHAPGAQVAFLGVFGYGLFASTLVPALAVGLNWPAATARGAVASIITGLVVTLVGETLSFAGLYRLPAGVPWSGVALVAALGVFSVVSLTGARRPA
jgi:Na+/pantothenate symporter